MNIGSNIRTLREANRLSQVELATKLNMDNSSYARIEKKGNQISYDVIDRIATALGISPIEIISGKKDDYTILLERKLENSAKTINEKNLLLGICLDFVESAVENKFCLEYLKLYNIEKTFEDISSKDLENIYRTYLCNDYLVYYSLKRGFIKNKELIKIHSDFMSFIEGRKEDGKVFTDYIKVKLFQPS